MTDLICRMAEEWFGIKADPDDALRLEKHILANSAANLERFFSSGAAAEFLTVNETYFFREPVHFSLLLELLPSFEKTGIRICSAATAAGCEAYSIAMLIEAYNKGAQRPVVYNIDAFDINAKAIETARKGIYSARSIREDGDCFKYMTIPYIKGQEDKYHVSDSIKKNINFFVHNLMDELYVEKYDIIFFRNAFIYFLPHKRERLLSNLSHILKEGGILILGVSETSGVQHADLVQKNRQLRSRWQIPSSFDDVFYFCKSAKQPV
ncbi:MAG: hypothetical protein FWD40_10745 [Treponema sp.]|nr:hypothetical protein [Treponema sp.]